MAFPYPPFNPFGNTPAAPTVASTEPPLDVTKTPAFSPSGSNLFSRIIQSLGGARGAPRVQLPNTLNREPGFGDFLLGALAGLYNTGAATAEAEEEKRRFEVERGLEARRVATGERQAKVAEGALDLDKTRENFAITKEVSEAARKIPNITPELIGALDKGYRGQIPLDDPTFIRATNLANPGLNELGETARRLALAEGKPDQEALGAGFRAMAKALANQELIDQQQIDLNKKLLLKYEQELDGVLNAGEAQRMVPVFYDRVNSIEQQLTRLAIESGNPSGVQDILVNLMNNQGNATPEDLAGLARLESAVPPEQGAKIAQIRSLILQYGGALLNLNRALTMSGFAPAAVKAPGGTGTTTNSLSTPRTFEGPPVDLSGPGLPGLLGKGATNLASTLGKLPITTVGAGGPTLGDALGFGRDMLSYVQEGLARKLGRDENTIVSNANDAIFWGVNASGDINKSLLTPLPEPGQPPPEPGPLGMNITQYAKLRTDVLAKGGTLDDVKYQLFLRLIQNEGFPELATELAKIRAKQIKERKKGGEVDISPSAIVGKGKK